MRALRVALLVPVAGCVLSVDPVEYPLQAGVYGAKWDEVLENSCFPHGLPVPREYSIRHEVRLEAPGLEITWPDELAPLTAMYGDARTSGRFEASESAALVVTSACTLDIAASISGVALSETLVGFRLTLDFDAGASDCTDFAGATVNNIEFPTLSNPANGSCTLRVEGLARGPR